LRPLVSIRAALGDPDLFGRVFAGESWSAWRVLLIAAMGEALTADERAVFESQTGRPQEPAQRVDEAWGICGRRSGKTRAAAVLAAYIAALCDHFDVLAPGERATLPILSASLWQAGKALQYLDGVFSTVPALKARPKNRSPMELRIRRVSRRRRCSSRSGPTARSTSFTSLHRRCTPEISRSVDQGGERR
jgi:hypothetical protein